MYGAAPRPDMWYAGAACPQLARTRPRREGLAHSDGRVRTVALIYDSIKFRERRA